MPINAHFIQAAKLLTPGASYSADLVLPHIRDLAGIAQRISVGGFGEVSISCEGQDVRGDTLRFPTLARISAPTLPGSERSAPPSVIDSAVVVALLSDEVVAEFGAERTVAAALVCRERGEWPVSVDALLTDLLAGVRVINISLSTPGARLRKRRDGSMTVGLRISC